ncbi:MAG: hypothetical protein PHT94_00200 [Candidatus Nanoarchaeia archaeon]|nr:hypothetical protein [Candidatus Nanoarchaeia archaeon]
MFEIGRLVLKVAGRDAGKVGVVISPIKEGKVLIDGIVRKKQVSIKHIIPLKVLLKVKENESSDVILSELEKLGYKVEEKYTSKFKKEKSEKSEKSEKKVKVEKKAKN